MEIPEYAADKKDSNYKQAYPFMPKDTFRMLISGPSGCGKTNTLLHMLLSPLLMYDCIYLYSKNLQQSAYKELEEKLDEVSTEAGYPILQSTDSIEEIIPLKELDADSQKIIIFDDLLTEKNQNDIVDYYIGGRHRNCSCIYLTQSFFKTNKAIRLNCTHHLIFAHPTTREKKDICKELDVPLDKFEEATKYPYNFAYVDRVSKKIFRNFYGKLDQDEDTDSDLYEEFDLLNIESD